MSPAGRLAATWGLVGVTALLTQALVRLSAHAWTALTAHALSPWQWLGVGVWSAAMVYFEGYRGFQRGFSPRVVVRAWSLGRQPSWVRGVLAPLVCMGLLWASRKRLVVSWSLLAGMVALVLGVSRLEQPWRGLIDVGVVLGLAHGLVALLGFAAWAAATGQLPDTPADLPAP